MWYLGRGHTPWSTMTYDLREGTFDGVPTWCTAYLIEAIGKKHPCVDCLESKRRAIDTPQGDGIPKKTIGAGWSFDFKQMGIHTIYGALSFFLFQELATGYLIALLTRAKNTATLVQAILAVQMWQESKIHKKIQYIRNDSGSIEIGGALKAKLQQEGLGHIDTDRAAAPEAQTSNPMEGAMGPVLTGTCTVLAAQDVLDEKHWGIALLYFIDNCNEQSNARTRELELDSTLKQWLENRRPH